MHRPGASVPVPHAVSATQTSTVRTPSPRNDPSWCHDGNASGFTRRSAHLFTDMAARSPR